MERQEKILCEICGEEAELICDNCGADICPMCSVVVGEMIVCWECEEVARICEEEKSKEAEL